MKRLLRAAALTAATLALPLALLLALSPQARAGVITHGSFASTLLAALRASGLPDTAPTDGQALTVDSSLGLTWATISAAGDIEGVTAGTNITGGGTSGTVTVNLDTSGSTIALTGSFALTGGGVRSTEGFFPRVYTHTSGVGNPTVLTAAMSGAIVNNTGATEAVYVTLPAASAGLRFMCRVSDAEGDDLRFVAVGNDTIRYRSAVTAAAGYVAGTSLGTVFILEAQDSTQWFVVDLEGDLTVGP